MLRMAVLSLLICLGLFTPAAFAGENTPAGYVIDLDLVGTDKETRKVVVRDGAEVETRLMMPLYDGDVVFVRDAKSSIEIELGAGELVKVGGNTPRYSVEGEITTGDGGWDLLGAIAGVLSGDDEQAPENMVSKGGALRLPMAVTGRPNWITPRNSLWLGWEGGTAPYSVTLTGAGEERVLAKDLTETSARLMLSVDGGKVPERFAIVIRDAGQQSVRIRFRVAEALPDEVRRGHGSAAAQALITAAGLTAIDDGSWSVEAAQAVGETGAGQALRQRIAAGWRLPTAD